MGNIIIKKNFDCIEHNKNSLNNNSSSIEPYINNTSVACSNIIGYCANESIPAVFLAISIIGLILNIILIKNFFTNKKTTNSIKQSSLKKLFATLPVLDSINCIYWIISSSVFWKAGKIEEYKESCAALSIIYFTIFTFEFIFINFILIHFRKISLNPIEGILKPGKNLKIYFGISIIATLAILGFAIWMKIIGRSPMITCFINTEESGLHALIFLIPTLLTFCIIIQVIYDLKCRNLFLNDKKVRESYKINSMYVLVYSLLHIPMLLLILITSGLNKLIQNYSSLTDYAFFTTLLTCSIPMIIGIIKSYRECTKSNLMKKLRERRTNSFSYKEYSSKSSSLVNQSPEDQFDWLEKHSLRFFMRDVLLSVAFCVKSSSSYGKNIQLKDLEKENECIIEHRVTKDNFNLDDRTVTQSAFLDVKILEYAPKIFAYLRNLENININEMIESFLPENNKRGISESQGKSGSFFIATDDNQYMIKTLRVDEFDLIRKTFLNEYEDYISKNPDSLLCRIYGMYHIIVSQGEEILIIVMRNVIGEFKDKIVAKYDLKGSTSNRTAEFDMEKTDSSTMKDLNFNEYEKGIIISNDNIQRFRKLIKVDSLFLSRMELMDYSLFLVKLTLSKEEINDLFNQDIQKIQEREFNDLMVQNSIQPSMTVTSFSMEDKELRYSNINIKEMKVAVKDNGKIFSYSKYLKQYIYPSLIPGTVYILAIIDYFQIFNFYKYVESTLKTTFGKNKNQVSCVDPKTYSERFYNYFIHLTDIKHLLKDGQRTDRSNIEVFDEEQSNDDNNNNIDIYNEEDNLKDENIDIDLISKEKEEKKEKKVPNVELELIS